jgi:hypothetical protein
MLLVLFARRSCCLTRLKLLIVFAPKFEFLYCSSRNVCTFPGPAPPERLARRCFAFTAAADVPADFPERIDLLSLLSFADAFLKKQLVKIYYVENKDKQLSQLLIMHNKKEDTRNPSISKLMKKDEWNLFGTEAIDFFLDNGFLENLEKSLDRIIYLAADPDREAPCEAPFDLP